MKRRLDYERALPGIRKAMAGLEEVVRRAGLEPLLLELVRIRASQVNGCAFCLDMHTQDARALGEDERRLHLLAAWREAPLYSERERAALAWCESLTLLAETGAPDGAYAPLEAAFSPAEVAALTMAIVSINGWNRVTVGFRVPAGSYRPATGPKGSE